MERIALNGVTLFDGDDFMLNLKSYIVVRYTEFLTDMEVIEEDLMTGYCIAKKRAESVGFFVRLNAFVCVGNINSPKEVKRIVDIINNSRK